MVMSWSPDRARSRGKPSRKFKTGVALLQSLRLAYTEGMGWRVMRGRTTVASGFDTREEAQARMAEL